MTSGGARGRAELESEAKGGGGELIRRDGDALAEQAAAAAGAAAIPPNLGGSSMFVYTPSAASAFRSTVMMPFFASQGGSGWNATTFLTNVDNLFNTQLTATLGLLIPANQSSIITIGVTTRGSPEVTAIGGDNRASGAPTTLFTIKWLLAMMCAFVAWF